MANYRKPLLNVGYCRAATETPYHQAPSPETLQFSPDRSLLVLSFPIRLIITHTRVGV